MLPLLFFLSVLHIPFPEKQELSNEDYLMAEELLKKVDVTALVFDCYPHEENFTSLMDIYERCAAGTNQSFIDPQKGLFPEKKLIKIGKGGKDCIVSFSSYNKTYPTLIKSIPQDLEKVGFNGYFLYQIGGYPNPTGKEMRYAAVPYAFKLFMILEAEKLGFENVLWIDSSLIPLADLTPLFNNIEKNGAFFLKFESAFYASFYCPPKTREILLEKTGFDVFDRQVLTPVFGLNMNRAKTWELILKYYELVEMGTPFLSCFPEEFVLVSLASPLFSDKCFFSHYSFLTYPIEGEVALETVDTTFYMRAH
jgi:hypothetical protein